MDTTPAAPPPSDQNATPRVRSPRAKAVVVLVHLLGLALVTAEIVLVMRWGEGAWDRRLGVLFAAVAFYGIALGFVTRSDHLRRFESMTDEMTSPNLVAMFVGNTVLMALACNVLAVGLEPRRTERGLSALSALGSVLLLPVGVLFAAYLVIHFLVLVPLAWAAYVLAGSVVEAVIGSATDTALVAHAADGTETRVTAKGLLGENPAAARSFLVGIPSAAVSLVLNLIGLFA